MDAVVRLDWTADRTLTVEHDADQLIVVAHPGLSQQEVERACVELGDHGPVVLAAWREAVGLIQPPSAS